MKYITLSNKTIFWLILIVAILILAGMGLRDPWPPDEPRFALMAKEMWETGNWFFPHRGGEIYPDKPPMVMWMILFFYAIIGNLKLAFLLPSAILSILTLWLTYDISKRLWNDKIGIYAAFLLALTLQFLLQAKSGQLDAPVAFWVMLACYAMLRHLILGPAWKWYYLSFFAMGLGIITKGVGFLPLLMLIALFFYPPNWYKKENKQILKWTFGLFFLVIAVSLWLLPMLFQVEMHPTTDLINYRDNILLKQTVSRYSKSWAHIQPFYFYLLEVIPLFWLPVSVFIPWLFKPIFRAFKNGERRIIYPAFMVIFAIFFFSLSKGKRAEYMLPILPMFVIMIAPFFEQLLQNIIIQRILLLLVLIFSLVILIIGIAGIFEVEKIYSLTAKYHINLWSWLISLGIFGLIVAFKFYKRGMVVYSIFIVGLWLSYSLWALPKVDKAMSTAPMIREISNVIPQNSELGIVGMREKLLLHTKWKTTHFGHHEPIKNQQQTAINWIKSKKNRFLLVNKNYLNSCFNVKDQIKYNSFHNEKWLLFDETAIVCPKSSTSFNSFTKQVQ